MTGFEDRQRRPDVLIVAGEHSGDEHAAALVQALWKQEPGCEVVALGGPALEACGVPLVYPLTQHAVVGFAEVVRHYGVFKRLFKALLGWIERNRPRVVCLVDYPGFNLRLAQALKDRGLSAKGGGAIRVCAYVAPQIWAWKAGRRFGMARTLDSLAVILPFEPELFKDTDLPVTFVGHPLVEAHRALVVYDAQAPVLLCPGSREALVRRHVPVFFGALEQLRLQRGEAVPAILRLPQDEKILRLLDAHACPSGVQLQHEGQVRASAVLTTAGTMSLHCALAGVPGVLAYKTHPVTYILAKRWIRVPYLGMANLLLPQPLYPEFIQSQARACALGRALEGVDPEAALAAAQELRRQLRAPDESSPATWLLEQL